MEMRNKILEIAQKMIQQRGFNGFSYADIAAEVGIRKSSLHHHFPTKVNLGMSLVDIYTEQLDSALTDIDNSLKPANEKLVAYIAIYRHSLTDKRICLGGMLASEALTLDPVMLPNLKEFFNMNTRWLMKVLGDGQSHQIFSLMSSTEAQARTFLSGLQGALLISRATENTQIFEQTSSSLIKNLMRKG